MFCNEQYFVSYMTPILETFGRVYSIFFSFMPNDEDDKLEHICLIVRYKLLLIASDDIELSKSNANISREGGGKDIILLSYNLLRMLCTLLKLCSSLAFLRLEPKQY